MANRYISELDAFNRDFRSFRARRTRMFLAARVAQADSSLRAMERSLVLYQKQKGAVVLPPDVRGSVDAAAGLMSDKAAAEVELELMRGYASPQSDEVRRLEARVNELGRQIGALPATQAGGADLLRQVTVQQEVYGFLTAQLEQARIREAMDTPTVQLLDSAKPPERRVWPRRSWIALFGLLAGALIGFVEPWRWSPRARTAG
jgi:tyrosine-protein kinase Etk/Wzc